MELIIDNWDLLLEQMCKEYNISTVSFDTWLSPLKPYKMVDNVVYILVTKNGNMAVDYINKKYKLPLQVSIGELLNKSCELVFLTPEDLEKENKPQTESEREFNFSSSLYTFENFVVSDNNRFAYAAALAVAESPGEVYNPLFIYSGVGLGKTHLMHSIAHYINKVSPEKNVLYVTSETFTNELIEAIRNKNENSISQFRDKYRSIDVLLIDDIQFIINKDRTQEEFFHTFNHLHLLKKQIVISSDKPPKELATLEERLLTRFEMGLIADISSPDYETRMAILEKNIEKKGYDIDKDILDYIATNVKSNIRELNGALNKLIAFTQLEKNKNLTLDIAERELRDIVSPDSPSVITPEFIIQIVCNKFDISYDEIQSKKRNSYLNIPRQIIMYLCRRYTSLSLEEIGKLLGRDHTTVMHGNENITKKMESDPEMKDLIRILVQMLNP